MCKDCFAEISSPQMALDYIREAHLIRVRVFLENLASFLEVIIHNSWISALRELGRNVLS